MTILGVPTFYNGEIPSAAKFNQLGNSVTAKFAGAITPGELVWPFTVEGNIDFDNLWNIVSLNKFWNIINADEYDSFDDAITAAEGMSGGACVMIPPSFAIEADTVDIDASNITIMGCGKSSVLKLKLGASGGYLLRTGLGSLSNIALENLTLDGQSVPDQVGVITRRVDGFSMRDVLVKSFDGDGVQITHDATPSHSCLDAKILDCKFLDGGANHVTVVDVDGLSIENMKSEGCAAIPIAMEPGSAASFIKRIKMSNIDIEAPAGVGVSILGASGTADDKWSLIDLQGVQVSGALADGFNLGLTAKILKYVTMVGCSAPLAAADGAKINVEGGSIIGNFFMDAVEDGIDLVDSDSVLVQGNNCQGAIIFGIDASGSTSCVVVNNNVITVLPAIAIKTVGATTPVIRDNMGHIGPTGYQVVDSTSYSRSSNGTLPTSGAGFYTLPADLVQVGDIIRVRAFFSKSGATAAGSAALELDGISVGTTGSTFTVATTVVAQWDIIVQAMSGANSANTLIDATFNTVAGGTDVQHAASTQTIDFTQDNILDFNVVVNAADTMLVRNTTVEIIGGNGTV